MPGFYTEVEVTGLQDAVRIAERVRNLGEDQTPLFQIAGGILEASVRRRFDEGRGPGGVPWTPSRRVQKHGGKTLVNKGVLESALRWIANRDGLELGFDRAAAQDRHPAAHQFGSHRQTVVVGHRRVIHQAFGVPIEARTVNVRPHGRMTNLPARPMIGVDDEDRADLNAAWLDYLKGLFQ